jgi:putative oxidoreductase
MARAGQKAAFLIGRAVLGGYFIYNGINHFKNRKMMAQYAGSKHVPAPHVAVPGTGVLLLFGGTSLLLGLKPRWGTLAIIAFLAGVSPMMHDFWKQEDPNQRMAEMVNFTKNMALLGAALTLAGVERWPLSLAAGGEKRGLERIRRSVRKMAA